jgi:hypothetical protein
MPHRYGFGLDGGALHRVCDEWPISQAGMVVICPRDTLDGFGGSASESVNFVARSGRSLVGLRPAHSVRSKMIAGLTG